jgi:hypothetical protein
MVARRPVNQEPKAITLQKYPWEREGKQPSLGLPDVARAAKLE